LLSSNHLTISNSTNSQNGNLTASQSSPRKPNLAKDKLLCLSSNKETLKKGVDYDKDKDEISLKNPSSGFNIQQSIDMDANNIETVNDLKEIKGKFFVNRKSDGDGKNYKDVFEFEDILADKRITFLNNNFHKKNDN
jgi:hypothetical protein